MKIIAFTKKNADFFSNFHDKNVDELEVSSTIDPKLISNNNADCLILEGSSVACLKKEKNFRHARSILLRLTFTSLTYGLFAGFRYLVRGRLTPKGFTRITDKNNRSCWYLNLAVSSKKKRLSERSYFPTKWTNREFLAWLDNQQVNYVVMRWFEAVIGEEDINDIDILISDDDIGRIRQALNIKLGTRAVDLHALGGGETGGIDKMAYFPPSIGRQLLQQRRQSKTSPGYNLSPINEFHSLAYHALFHKGYNSEIPVSKSSHDQPSGKIYRRLRELQKDLRITVDLNMNSLLDYLANEGWVPPSDMLAKLSSNNEWIKDTLAPSSRYDGNLRGSYFVILLREIVEEWALQDVLIKDIENEGFNILYKQTLNTSERQVISQQIRGGNWSAGPWPVSGGLPLIFLIIQDKNPKPLTRKQRKKHPTIQNSRILFKQKWREKINAAHGANKAANFVHTSDNNKETLEYLSHIAPASLEIILNAEKQ